MWIKYVKFTQDIKGLDSGQGSEARPRKGRQGF